jgi:hypothetical protein
MGDWLCLVAGKWQRFSFLFGLSVGQRSENGSVADLVLASRLPIYVDGFLIGGVGVSGGTVPQDVEVAMAGLDGIGASASLS